MQWNLKKKKKNKLIIIVVIGIIIIAGIFLIISEQKSLFNLKPNILEGFISAGSFDLEDNRTIGYELLDNNKVVHIWNSRDDYYFDRYSGMQFTNHFQEYWTKNVFCIGYYSGEEWIKINCVDELEGFNRNIHTDNETYVNATLWNDIEYGNYNMRLAINYYLGLNDKSLSITIYGKNIGIDIPFDLGFAWRVKDIQISTDKINDKIKINNLEYWLNNSLDLTFNNMEEGRYELYDVNTLQYLWLDWEDNLTYKVEVKNTTEQYNAPVTLGINVGTLTAGQEKHTTMYWFDAPIVVDSYEPTADGTYRLYTGSNERAGQSFTGDGGTLNSAVFKGYKSGSPTGDLTYSIFAHTGTFGVSSEPTGGALATSDSVDVSTLETSAAEIPLVFSGGNKITLTDGTKYVILSEYSDGDSSNHIRLWYRFGSPTHDGNAVWADNGQAPWTTESGEDFWFIVYKDDAPADNEYPQFSNYWDNNASLVDSGTGLFNVTLLSTNGTVWLEINNSNYTAMNLTANVYNISVDFTEGGVYSYKWHSWGNGTSENYNVSNTRSYTVNVTPVAYLVSIISPNTSTPKSVTSGDNITITFNFTEDGANITSGVTLENITIGGVEAPLVGDAGAEVNWEFIGSTTATVPEESTLEILLPGDEAEGDLVVVATAIDYNVNDIVINTPGYTQIYSSGDANPESVVSYIVLNSTTGNNVSVSALEAGSNSRTVPVGVQVWRGVNTTVPLDTSAVTTVSSTGAPNPPAYDPDFNNSLIFAIGLLDDDNRASSTTAPAGFGNLTAWNASIDNPEGATIMMASLVQASHVSINPAAFGMDATSEQYDAITFAFHKSEGTAPTEQFGHVVGIGWQANVTVPTFESGLKDLFVNATYDGNTRNDTEVNAITYGVTDTCTCAGLNNDWEVDMSDFCELDTACELGTGTLNFTGSGNATCSVNINTTNLGDPGASGILYISNGCLINIFSFIYGLLIK